MRRTVPILLLVGIIMASGCLFRPPAEVHFSVDKTLVNPGGTIHLIVFINNTGKVGLTGATLLIKSEDFKVLQEPDFPSVLPVGKSLQLVWIIQAPTKPGAYDLKVSLELNDELKRTWTGFYSQFRITVGTEIPSTAPLEVKISAPETVIGGSTAEVGVFIRNKAGINVSLDDVFLTLLPGMEVTNHSEVPVRVAPGKTVSVYYRVKFPYAYRKGYISTLVKYTIGNSKRSLARSAMIRVIWQPWTQNEVVLKEAYGDNYRWLYGRFLVDAYWARKYNSTPTYDSAKLRKIALPLVNSSVSELGAAEELYKWLESNYKIGGNTSTLDTSEMIQKDTLSVSEAQILLTALLRSVGIPARVVTLYNGTDCTINPITEFYTADGWDVIDVRQGIVAPVDAFIASKRFPKMYQLITERGYRLVAQAPQDMVGHEHVDVTPYFLINIRDRLLKEVSQRVRPELRSKLNLVLEGFDENEELYTLFLFASAPPDQLNNVFTVYSVKEIRETVKPIYEFYWGVPWSWDFSKYWKIFLEGLP